MIDGVLHGGLDSRALPAAAAEGEGMRRLSVAVAMCTYDGERFVGEQLASFARQTRLPDRVVVVDDGSRDSTLEVVGRFAADAPFPVDVYWNERTLGYVKNFERAIGIPAEDVIALSDQDDVWREDKLEKVVSALEADAGLALVFSDASLVDAQLRPIGDRLWQTVELAGHEQEAIREGRSFEVLLRRNRVTGAATALRRSAWELVRPIPEGAVHDEWIGLVLAGVSRVGIVPEPLIDYRQHGGNQLGGRRLGMIDRLKRARRQRFQELDRRRELLVELRSRFEGRGIEPGRMASLEGAIRHLELRLALPRRRVRRVPAVAGSWLRGEYGRNANGLPSALRDLVV
jgi:glycosyltransferase involved in cell wall biosynthesis